MRQSVTDAVYLLDIDHDDPRVERFVPAVEEPALLGRRGHNHCDRVTDFYPEWPYSAQWRPPRLKDVWTPLKVAGRIREWNDHPTLKGIPAFSQRAVDALRNILEANGELLPLVYEHGRWWAYNLLTVADVVDVERSTPYECHTNRYDVPTYFDHFVLHEERLDGLMIFRIRQEPVRTFVTQPFVDRVREAGLRNFVFSKIWPWPAGTRWVTEDKKARRERKVDRDSAALRRHSLVIRLATGGRAKPNKRQREHVAKIMDSLDALLADPHAPYDAPVFGNLEGDEPVAGEHRLFLSCPDADRLAERLRPWLRRLDWPGSVSIMKRYGDMRDPDVKEETLVGPW